MFATSCWGVILCCTFKFQIQIPEPGNAHRRGVASRASREHETAPKSKVFIHGISLRPCFLLLCSCWCWVFGSTTQAAPARAARATHRPQQEADRGVGERRKRRQGPFFKQYIINYVNVLRLRVCQVCRHMHMLVVF